jgi:hypothetical protein
MRACRQLGQEYHYAPAGEDQRRKAAFAETLLQIGDGRVGGPPGTASHGKFPIPSRMLAPDNTIDGLIGAVFDDIQSNFNQPGYIKVRAILSQKNIDVDAINNQILDMVPGEVGFRSLLPPYLLLPSLLLHTTYQNA